MSAGTDKNTVYLTVGDTRHEGWLSLSIQRTIEACAASFSMSVTQGWPGEDNPVRIRPGQACKVAIGNDTVITGYIDSVDISFDGHAHDIQVSGHSKTIDLVECSAIVDKSFSGQWKTPRTLKQIATDLCKPYSIEVACGETDLIKHKKCTVETGQTVFEVIEKLAREDGLLVTDDCYGRLVLTRLGDKECPDLTHPGNILKGSVKCSTSGRYSEYIAKGQKAGDDDNWGELVAGIQDLAKDEELDPERRRVLIFKMEKQAGKDDCKKRVNYEATTRAGKSASAEITVQGWRASDGLLWDSNATVWVEAPVLGINGSLLVSGVHFSLDNGGQLTTLTVAPIDGFKQEMPKGKKTVTGSFGVFGYVKGEVQ